MNRYALVGCRSSRMRNARGKGVELYKIDQANEWQYLSTIAGQQDNPSWVTVDPESNDIYVTYGDGDLVSCYNFNNSGQTLEHKWSCSTGDRHPHPENEPLRRNNPVHIELSPDRNMLIVVNHESGNLAFIPLRETLVRGDGTKYIHFPGQSNVEMSVSRPHQIVYDRDKEYMFVPAQGRKRGSGVNILHMYRYKNTDFPVLADSFVFPEGTWPRHVCVHPVLDRLYCINELGCDIYCFKIDRLEGKLEYVQQVRSLPEKHEFKYDTSELLIHPTGRFLYSTNRIHNSISLFNVDAISGEISFVESVHCGGKTPRFAILSEDGGRLYCANEDSDLIVEFMINENNGTLSRTEQNIVTQSPTCIAFIQKGN